MELPRGSISVWPGYVAAVASLLLSLLLLAGVLVVSMTQVGRVVGAYNQQLLVTIAEDERRKIELEQTRASLALAQKKAASNPARPAPEVAGESLAALQARLQQQSAELARAEAESLALQGQLRQLARPAGGDAGNTYRFVFGAGAQGLDAEAIKGLAAALGPQERSASTRWLMQAEVKDMTGVSRREVYRLMLGIRAQLQALGVNPNQVRLVLDQERAPEAAPGQGEPGRADDLVIVLRAQKEVRP